MDEATTGEVAPEGLNVCLMEFGISVTILFNIA